MEDLEQIFLRSWRESHVVETRPYPPAMPPCPPAPGPAGPVTPAQLPWLAGLAASSCNDSVHVIECASSLAEGLAEMFRLLVDGKLAKTNYVVIICACRSAALDSCIAVTGEPRPPPGLGDPAPRRRAGGEGRSHRPGPPRDPRADAEPRGHQLCLPGKYQARVLSESLLTPAEYQQEVSYALVTGKVDSLGAFFSSLCPGGPVGDGVRREGIMGSPS